MLLNAQRLTEKKKKLFEASSATVWPMVTEDINKGKIILNKWE